jgi:DNA-binding transcriptional regulator YiaG
LCHPTLDGSYELRRQIAHWLTWWLTEMRLRAQMNQGELGNKLGTTQEAVAKWERGRTLISLADLPNSAT